MKINAKKYGKLTEMGEFEILEQDGYLLIHGNDESTKTHYLVVHAKVDKPVGECGPDEVEFAEIPLVDFHNLVVLYVFYKNGNEQALLTFAEDLRNIFNK